MERSRAGVILRWVATLVGALILMRILWTADLPRAWSHVARVGPKMALVAVPYLGVVGFDALAWKWIFAILDRELGFFRLLVVRLSTEAVLLSFPGGVFLAEGLKPVLLVRDGVPPAETAATIGAKKVMLLATQSIYLAAAALLGFRVLATIASKLPYVVLGTSVVVGLTAAAMLAMFVHGSLGARSHALLERIPIASVRTWLATRREGFAAADTHVGSVFAAHPVRLAAAAVPFLLSWLAESLESFTILYFLGANLSFVDVMAFEAVVSLLRSLVFFIPAGIGVQDAGYVASLTALSVSDPKNLAAAFVLIKRAKEVCWIVIGYTLLMLINSARAPSPSSDSH